MCISRSFVVSGLLAVAVDAKAGLIIDDFNDPAVIELPGGPESVATEGVGDLAAERTVSFDVLRAPQDSDARADIALSIPHHLAVQVAEIAPADPGNVLFTDLVYENFGNHDFTDNGKNDSLLIDITSAPDSPLPVIRITATQADGTLLLREFTNGHPFFTTPATMVLPFETFTNRGGGTLAADFTSIRRLRLGLSSASFFGSWRITIDSIRVDSINPIPEPSTAVLGMAMALAGLGGWFLFERRRHSGGPRNVTLYESLW